MPRRHMHGPQQTGQPAFLRADAVVDVIIAVKKRPRAAGQQRLNLKAASARRWRRAIRRASRHCSATPPLSRRQSWPPTAGNRPARATGFQPPAARNRKLKRSWGSEGYRLEGYRQEAADVRPDPASCSLWPSACRLPPAGVPHPPTLTLFMVSVAGRLCKAVSLAISSCNAPPARGGASLRLEPPARRHYDSTDWAANVVRQERRSGTSDLRPPTSSLLPCEHSTRCSSTSIARPIRWI